MKKTEQIITLLLGIFLLASCEREYLIPKQVTSAEVSFSKDLIPLFDKSCNETGCHITGGEVPDLTAGNAYSDLFLYSFVDTSFAELSILYTRMNSVADPMPVAGKLPQDKVDLVLNWIKQGAKDN